MQLHAPACLAEGCMHDYIDMQLRGTGDLQAWQQHVSLAGCILVESYDKVEVRSSQLQVCRPGSPQLQHLACLTA